MCVHDLSVVLPCVNDSAVWLFICQFLFMQLIALIMKE